MKPRKTALLLAVVITALAVMTAVPALKAEAATAAQIRYFLDTLGPMCTIDMRDNHILASFSLAQAIWESGWGTSTLAKEANALFGIRAYSTWGGMVYDRNEKVLYDSWAVMKATKGDNYLKTYKNSFWRAYTSWQESVNDHSALFNKGSNYKCLRGNYDYKSCCELITGTGYCSDPSYPSKLISLIEGYNLSQYDYDFENGNTNAAISITPGALFMDKGASYILEIRADEEITDFDLKSDNSAVATVSGTTLKTVGNGTAKITLTAGELSATCTVTVKDGYGAIIADGVYVKCLADGDTVTVPSEAKSIAAGAFEGVKASTVVVGSSVNSIEDGAFNGLGADFTLCTYDNGVVKEFASKNSIGCVNLAGWSIDKSVSILSGIQVYTTVSVVDMYYKIEGSTVTVTNAAGNALGEADYVGTGCKIKIDGKTYTVTVKGDTDGDGRSSTADLVLMKTYLAGADSALPERAFRRAADYNSDNRITTTDYMAVIRNM